MCLVPGSRKNQMVIDCNVLNSVPEVAINDVALNTMLEVITDSVVLDCELKEVDVLGFVFDVVVADIVHESAHEEVAVDGVVHDFRHGMVVGGAVLDSVHEAVVGDVVLDLVPEVVVVDDVAFDIVVNGVVLDFDSMPESPMRSSPK